MAISDDVLWEMDWADVPSEPVTVAAAPSTPIAPPPTPASIVSPRREVMPAAIQPAIVSLPTPPARGEVALESPAMKPAIAAPNAPPPPAKTRDSASASLMRGQRVDLAKLQLDLVEFEAGYRCRREGVKFDIVCAGLAASDHVPSEGYLVRAGQVRSPCGGMQLLGPIAGEQRVRLNLQEMPPHIQRVVIAVVSEMGEDGLGEAGMLRLGKGREVQAAFDWAGAELPGPAGVHLAEIYLRQGLWRLFVRAETFSGGLAAFIREFGHT